MSYELIQQRGSAWIGQAVFALDRWLCRRSGSFEYSDRPDCVLRIQPYAAPHDLRLSDGTVVRAGERTLRLHLWSEHMPRMGRGGPSLRWARRINRSVERSLRELAQYLDARSEFDGIRVLFADMNLATARQARQFQRIVVRLGFEPVPEQPPRGLLRQIGEVILVLLLVIASNPAGLRHALRGHQRRIYLSRSALQARFGPAARRSGPHATHAARGLSR